jgi:hypothetical protein
VNIFEDPELRDALKKFSNWPTYPQLYVNGELVGGCDIVLDMHRSGELKKAAHEAAPARRNAGTPPIGGPSRPSGRGLAPPHAARALGLAPHAVERVAHLAEQSAVRSASYVAECAALESHSMPHTCAAFASTVCPNAAPASVAVSKHENG